MALQVWLPLNGNLNNQGLTNVTVTNNGATVDNNGKIGKCYNFDGTYISFNRPLPNPCSAFTVCGWVKLSTGYAANYGLHLISFETSYGRICISKDGQAVRVLLNYNGTTSATGSTATASSVSANMWNHYAVTFDSGKINIYINGQLDNSYTVNISQVSIASSILKVGTYGGEPSKGCVNDFRLYDHALSPREIEILSRGLVAHYPLNGGGRGGDNILKGTNLGKSGWFWSAASGSRSVETYDVTGVKMTVVEVGSSWNMWGFISTNLANSLQPDTDYTVSVDILPPQDANIKCGIIETNATNPICPFVTQSVEANKWNHLVFNLHSNSSFTASNQVIYMNGIAPDTVGKTIYLKNLKMELGTVATPWMPNPADSAYTAMGYNSTTEYDVSGYGYNGTKTQAMSYTSDTARYSVATIFDGSLDSIKIPSLFQMLGSNGAAPYSIAVWTYKDSIGSKGYQTILGGGSGFELEARNGSGTDPQYVLWNWGKVAASYEFGKWTHVVFTKQDNAVKLYVNGVLANEGTSSTSVPDNNYWIGSWNSSSAQNFEGRMSDFRIYATALSATQVAELYNTAVSVANNGTLMGYELVEG